MTAIDTTDREEWLAWRLGGIGASDVAAAHTGRYGGAYKAVAARLGIVVDQIDPADADRGHRWEQPVADTVYATKGLHVVGEQLGLEHAGNRRHRATVDGLLAPIPEPEMADVTAGLEIKTRLPHAPWPWDYWEAQAQFGMHVSGLDRWLLVIATIDVELDQATAAVTEEVVGLRFHWLHADPFVQAELAELADWLLDHIDRRVLPDPVDAGALPYVEAANAIADPGATADIDDLAELLERHDQLAAAASAAAAELKTARAQIRARMGSATEAHTSDGAWRVRIGQPVRRLTRATENEFIEAFCTHNDACGPDCDQHRPDLLDARLNVEAARQEGFEDVLDAFKTETTERRLTIKRLTPESES